MVKYQKKSTMYNMNNNNQWKKSSKEVVVQEEDELELLCLDPFGITPRLNTFHHNIIRTKPRLLFFVYVAIISTSLILAATLFCNSNFSLLYSYEGGVNGFICSSVSNGTICCDRNSIRTDICIMKGDIRTQSASSSIVLYNTDGLYGFNDNNEAEAIQHEKIKPYTRKWETSVMDTINELALVAKRDSGHNHKCDVYHDVPAVVFSTGGYTGNLYHEFNDGILPLYITSQRFNKKVIFVILEYHNWWITKYGDILSELSDFPPLDFTGDKRVHCFSEVIVGLRIHDELTVDGRLMEGNKTVRDFHELLNRAYWPRIRSLIEDEEREAQTNMEAGSPSLVNPIRAKVEKRDTTRPKMVIVSRNGSRSITNEGLLVKMAEDIGFEVEVLKPDRTDELAKIYRALNSSDVMIGVHGAAMTHFLFMKPNSVFIQVVPLGTDWAAETYYGEPAKKLGLSYIGYKILPKESSLYNDYDKKDPVLMDPDSVNQKGWQYTKKIYLDRQTVKLDLRRFQKRLLRAYYYTIARKNGRLRRLMQ